jgi:hypothetical protein
VTPHAQWDALLKLHEQAKQSHYSDESMLAFETAAWATVPALAAEYRRMRDQVQAVQELMDLEGSCGETGCSTIATCEIKRRWDALRGAKGAP